MVLHFVLDSYLHEVMNAFLQRSELINLKQTVRIILTFAVSHEGIHRVGLGHVLARVLSTPCFWERHWRGYLDTNDGQGQVLTMAKGH